VIDDTQLQMASQIYCDGMTMNVFITPHLRIVHLHLCQQI